MLRLAHWVSLQPSKELPTSRRVTLRRAAFCKKADRSSRGGSMHCSLRTRRLDPLNPHPLGAGGTSRRNLSYNPNPTRFSSSPGNGAASAAMASRTSPNRSPNARVRVVMADRGLQRVGLTCQPLRSGCDAAVEPWVPGRPLRAGRRPDADVEPRVQRGSRRAGWLHDTQAESWMQSIPRGAFLSRQSHVRHRALRIMGQERHGLSVCPDQRRRHYSASKRKIGRPKHPPLPPNCNA